MKYNPTLHKLSNGVSVILDPMDIETTSVGVSFNTGARDEAPHEYGITHFCEHILCKGTMRFSARRDIENYLKDNGGESNAFTSATELQFHGRIIGSNLDKLIDVLADQLQNSQFDSERIELEKIVVLDELRRKQDDKDKQFIDLLSKELFGTSLYSYQVLGTKQNIKSFTREQLLNWVKKRLSAKNCTIVISGKIPDKNAVLKQLNDRFAFLSTHDVTENKAQKYHQKIMHEHSVQTKNTSICVAIPRRFEFDEAVRLERTCEILFKKYLREEIYDELRQKHGLVYGVSVSVFGGEKGCHLIETECAPENVAKVTELIAKTCARVYNEKTITDDWLKRYENSCLLGDADWLDSATKRSSTLLSEYRYSGKLYDFYEIVEMSKNITALDVQKHIHGFFDMPISIITKGPDFNADLGAIWKQNFPNSNIATAQNKITNRIQDTVLGR